MREIRLSGSEGGGPQTNAVSLPPIRLDRYQPIRSWDIRSLVTIIILPNQLPVRIFQG